MTSTPSWKMSVTRCALAADGGDGYLTLRSVTSAPASAAFDAHTRAWIEFTLAMAATRRPAHRWPNDW